MGGLVETITGLLDRRQLATTYGPAVAFLSALGVVVASAQGWSRCLRAWESLPIAAQLLVPVAALGVVLLLGQVLQTCRLPVIRMLEGYWAGLPGGRRLAERCRRRHREMRDRAAESDPRRHEYPSADRHVMPTTLGNVLRGAETHSTYRYDLDGVVAWPRLYPTLPEGFQQLFAAATGRLEAMATLSALGAFFAAVGGVLGTCLLPWYGAAACVLGGGAVAWAGYWGAVGAARAYGQLYRSAFDVHRWALLDAMGLTRPGDYRAERRQWRALSRLWLLGAVDTHAVGDLGYTAATPALLVPPASPPVPPPPAPPAAPDPAAPDPAAPDPGAPVRLGRRLTAVLLVAAVVAACAAALRPGADQGCRTRTALPAYHQLRPGDVRGSVCTKVVGHYLLQGVRADRTLSSAVLGPALAPAALTGREWTVLSPTPAQDLARTVARGAEVSVVVVPPKGPYRAVEGLRVLDLLDRGRRVVVAGTAAQLRTLLSAGARSEVHLLLSPG
ncbi:hypothetical protein U5640_40720 [Streptomyces sp. SS7]|uniref:hypothetical protein n=1 Tax=Streptomyces sp. SS7 TaxID=3108485 RepID=UPI0030EF87FF